jgi:hypothetical protein
MSDDSRKATKIGVSVMIHQPPPPKKEHPEERRPSVEDKVRDCIERIDNGCGTEVDFLTLKKLKAAIQSRPKQTPRMVNLVKMIDPIMRRFGYYF